MRIKIGISEREKQFANRGTAKCVVEPVSGSGVTSQKINRVRYYVEARSALRRRAVREGGKDGGMEERRILSWRYIARCRSL